MQAVIARSFVPVGRFYNYVLIAAAVHFFSVERADEIFITHIAKHLEFSEKFLYFGIVIAEDYCKRNVSFSYRQSDFVNRFLNVFVVKFLPVAADVVPAENNEIRLRHFNAFFNNVYGFNAAVARNFKIFVVVHFGVNFVDVG